MIDALNPKFHVFMPGPKKSEKIASTENYDVATGRAVARLPVLCEYLSASGTCRWGDAGDEGPYGQRRSQ